MQQGNDTGRADQVFAALEAVTLGGISARMRSDSVFENARQVWGAGLNRLTEKQFERVLRRIETDVVKGVPSLGEVLALARSEFDGCL